MAHQATMRQYLAVCGLENIRPDPLIQEFIDSRGISGIEYFKLVQVKDVKSMIKNHNDDPTTSHWVHRTGTEEHRRPSNLGTRPSQEAASANHSKLE